MFMVVAISNFLKLMIPMAFLTSGLFSVGSTTAMLLCPFCARRVVHTRALLLGVRRGGLLRRARVRSASGDTAERSPRCLCQVTLPVPACECPSCPPDLPSTYHGASLKKFSL